MIRVATSTDAGDISAIYAPIVGDTIISFELEPPSVEEIGQRISDTLTTLPWVVFESERRIVGYAYASPHRTRLAYQWSVDVSVYVDPSVQRRGLGRKLYSVLLEILRAQGYYNAYAGIALPNNASVGLHEALGFEPVGVYRNVGYKLGRWRDVGWWALALRRHDESPRPPRRFTELQGSTELEDLLNSTLTDWP
jgi:phosphinothricin acetyltransferase